MVSETDDRDQCTWPRNPALLSAPEKQQWLALQALSIMSSLLSMYTNIHDIHMLT